MTMPIRIKTSHLNDPTVVNLILAVLISRLGGEVKITQDDINSIAYRTLLEGDFPDGSIAFKLTEKGIPT